MFYVILNKRKRLGDCVTFSYIYPGRGRAHIYTVMFLNMRYMRKTHARILDAVKCQGAASVQSTRRLPVLSESGVHVSCTSHQLDRSRSPKMHCIHLLVIIRTL